MRNELSFFIAIMSTKINIDSVNIGEVRHVGLKPGLLTDVEIEYVDGKKERFLYQSLQEARDDLDELFVRIQRLNSKIYMEVKRE